MNCIRIRWTLFATFLACTILFGQCPVIFAKAAQPEAKPAQPKTVLDYCLLLPDERYFEVPKSERKKWLYRDKNKFGPVKPIVDIKNDYILFPGDGAQGTLHIALFRYNGRVLVAVRNEFEEGSLDFLHYEKGRWTDVTKQMMPVPYNEDYDYKIPRYGTTIRVTGGRYHYKRTERSPDEGKKVYDLVWVGGKFKVRR